MALACPSYPLSPYQLDRLGVMRHGLPNVSPDWSVITGLSPQSSQPKCERGACSPSVGKAAAGHWGMGLEQLSYTLLVIHTLHTYTCSHTFIDSHTCTHLKHVCTLLLRLPFKAYTLRLHTFSH